MLPAKPCPVNWMIAAVLPDWLTTELVVIV